jgi:ankyrin repeat protein
MKPSEEHSDAVYYELVMEEIQSGDLNRGLMAKAIAKSKGDKKGAEVLYLEWRVKILQEEAFNEFKRRETEKRQKQEEEQNKLRKELAAGADVEVKDDVLGATRLHRAASEGHKEIVELLIAKGADVYAKANQFGGTPLHFAANNGHKEVAELLIANGADVNAKNDLSFTPLDTAIIGNHPETADLLCKHGGETGKELKAAGS